MQVKTFTAKDAPSAMARVKAELGGDAVILSTRKCAEGGRSWCEVTAALDSQPPKARPAAPAPDEAPAPGWGEWHREWDQIKAHLTALMRPQLDLGALAPRQRQALEHLEGEGVGEGAVMALAAALRADRQASILAPLGAMVAAAPLDARHWPQRLHAVVGPSGSGKTTTLLRMALACQQARPGARILLVNADAAQAKGRMFLKHYAELSGITFREAASPRDLAGVLAAGQKFDKVFLDLPPVGAGLTLEGYLKLLGLSERDDLAVHLVLSPLYASAQLSSYLRVYKSPKTASLVWTKLDEACNYGDIVNAAYATGLPVSALSFGSGLRGTLVPAKAIMLWKLLFKHELPQSPIEENRGRYAH